jgi:thiamine pyrophosphate-dependent acetolactate synthase large subunit-like protein
MNTPAAKGPRSIHHDAPVASPRAADIWGSDAIAAVLREIRIPYLALNPGASYRGLHDSLVNYLGNSAPQMLLCLHEESAVAIAHGYAKASGRMMGAVLHSNVGLMHASMAIFNAWCDRAPVLLLGATGPVDAAKRRPWIDWLHTSRDQGALIRDYTKWDDQPASVAAAQEALLRAAQIAQTAPCGPTYVNIDAEIQEAKIGPAPTLPEASRFLPPPSVNPPPASLAAAARLLSEAKRPVILMGRVGRGEEAWRQRIAMAERLQAPVLTDFKAAAAFPTDHPLLMAPPSFFLTSETMAEVKKSDVILSLDWIDLGGTLRQIWGQQAVTAKVVQVSLDQHLHRGWGMEYFGLAPTDIYLLCEPDIAVPMLTKAVQPRPASGVSFAAMAGAAPQRLPDSGPISMKHLADAVNEATEGLDVCVTRLPLGWNGAYRHFRHPLDYLGYDGGAGIGSGPGMSVGSALALKGSGRLAVAILGDGDFMMGSSALWTAVHYEIPLLIVVANNRSFYNDEVHQERVAKIRGRPVENKWIGQRIGKPDIDLAMIARAQGAEGIGPVTEPASVLAAVRRGLTVVEGGGVAVVDVRVLPGYDTNMSGSPSAAQRSH